MGRFREKKEKERERKRMDWTVMDRVGKSSSKICEHGLGDESVLPAFQTQRFLKDTATHTHSTLVLPHITN
jgi:hypothetical protein